MEGRSVASVGGVCVGMVTTILFFLMVPRPPESTPFPHPALLRSPNSLSGTIRLLTEFPEQRQMVLDDPSLIERMSHAGRAHA